MDTRAARHSQRTALPPRAAGRPAVCNTVEAYAEDIPADDAAARYGDAALDAMAARGPGMAAAAAALRTIADPEDRAAVMDDAHALVALHGRRYVAAVEEIAAAFHGGQDLGQLAAERDARNGGEQGRKQAERVAKAATGHVL